jgi:hypothetical protein
MLSVRRWMPLEAGKWSCSHPDVPAPINSATFDIGETSLDN